MTVLWIFLTARMWPRAQRRPRDIARRDAASGQGMVEYALILAFVGTIVIVALKFLQPAINSSINAVAWQLKPPSSTAQVALSGTPCQPTTTAVVLARNGTITFDGSTCFSGASVTMTAPDGSSAVGSPMMIAVASSATTASNTFSTAGTYTFSVGGVSGTITVI